MEQVKRPFKASHRREDGLSAMLLSIFDGQVLYRVRWFEKERCIENTLSRSEATFRKLFQPV